MPSSEKPILLSMSLCDLVVRDERTHKISLINLFNEVRAPQFPCHHPRLHVYVCLTNGRGEYQGALTFVDADEDKVLAKLEGRLAFRSPLQVVEMNFELNAVAFPHPGTYRFEFLCDGELIGARTLRAIAGAGTSPMGPPPPDLTPGE
jgi:hypothetical protein